jgi:geranylgeranyl diphosphate synthase type II
MRTPGQAARSEVVAFLDEAAQRTDEVLESAFGAGVGGPPRLLEAMRYSVFAGGKRLRPALAIACCRALGGADDHVLPFAAAVELVHTYSLVHDDLPAMDDDDLRRGQPTSHRVFGEATAILAGDALHTLAFEVVLARTESAGLARSLAIELARAAGPGGMVGGQVEDLASDGAPPDGDRIRRIHRGKTVALLRAACRGGALAAGAAVDELEAIDRYGTCLGHAFQIVDDVLDVTGTAEELGKTPGKDRARRKMTHVALHGVAGARRLADLEVEGALAALEPLPRRDLLSALARHVAVRGR